MSFFEKMLLFFLNGHALHYLVIGTYMNVRTFGEHLAKLQANTLDRVIRSICFRLVLKDAELAR